MPKHEEALQDTLARLIHRIQTGQTPQPLHPDTLDLLVQAHDKEAAVDLKCAPFITPSPADAFVRNPLAIDTPEARARVVALVQTLRIA